MPEGVSRSGESVVPSVTRGVDGPKSIPRGKVGVRRKRGLFIRRGVVRDNLPLGELLRGRSLSITMRGTQQGEGPRAM